MPEGKYILTQHIHLTQKTLEHTAEVLRISLFVNLNYEFRAIVLSYGSQVKILRLEHFRNEIIAEMEAAIKLYEYH